MCGRYSVLTEDEIIEIRTILHDISISLVRDDMDNYLPRRGEVRPTDKSPVVIMNNDGLSFENARFGFKKWDGKGVIINARSETLHSKSMFSTLLDIGRCVVPANEYYEWKEQEDAGKNLKPAKKKKIKHFVKDKAGNLLFFAGLYRDTADGREFIVITKEAIGDVAKIHDRMPVILRVNQLELWLNGTFSADDIMRMDFNVDATPCEDEPDANQEDDGQISLF